ncbi:hypothetical protein Ocin01_02699 [Orchesella cincta]|uniref:Uncharacterized protein n=1 Tax=Orchesella cincta TaxID=48709 RepID=A0A1D2NFF5_ORCCI|nr:hypothetical protein Ocin01_02699 [Orchesella cincta]
MTGIIGDLLAQYLLITCILLDFRWEDAVAATDEPNADTFSTRPCHIPLLPEEEPEGEEEDELLLVLPLPPKLFGFGAPMPLAVLKLDLTMISLGILGSSDGPAVMSSMLSS